MDGAEGSREPVANDAGSAGTARQVIVDARGSRCPVPIAKLSDALASVTPATVIELLADDPNARVDVPVWCRLKHIDLVEAVEADGAWRFTVRASQPSPEPADTAVPPAENRRRRPESARARPGRA